MIGGGNDCDYFVGNFLVWVCIECGFDWYFWLYVVDEGFIDFDFDFQGIYVYDGVDVGMGEFVVG